MPEMCPCGCGMEREEGIRVAIDGLGWPRERVEAAMAQLEQRAKSGQEPNK